VASVVQKYPGAMVFARYRQYSVVMEVEMLHCHIRGQICKKLEEATAWN
jgi:hypothetical protein